MNKSQNFTFILLLICGISGLSQFDFVKRSTPDQISFNTKNLPKKLHTSNIGENISVCHIPLHNGFEDKFDSADGKGMTLYSLNNYDELLIYNLSNPFHPELNVRMSLSYDFYELSVENNNIYLVSNHFIMIYEISSPFSPVYLSNYTSDVSFSQFQIYGDFGLAQTDEYVVLYNLSDHLDIKVLDTYPIFNYYPDIGMYGNTIFLARIGSLMFLNITDALNISFIKEYTNLRIYDFAVYQNCAYIHTYGTGYLVYNISNPLNIYRCGSYVGSNMNFYPHEFYIFNSWLFCYASEIIEWEDHFGLYIFSLENPSIPQEIWKYKTNLDYFNFHCRHSNEFLYICTDSFEMLSVGLDTDKDQLLDWMELEISGTNIYLNDTEGDGMTDYWEFYYNLDPNINDSGEDPDEDLLINIDEFIFKTNPYSADTDRDGLNDYVEITTFNTDPLLEDTDGDLLKDIDEILVYTTNPNDIDTDFDRLTDYDELFIHFTDPLLADTDGDGLDDYGEILVYFSNPFLKDTDDDGLNDFLEIKYNTDPNCTDTDGDGFTDNFEVKVGMDPLTPSGGFIFRVSLVIVGLVGIVVFSIVYFNHKS